MGESLFFDAFILMLVGMGTVFTILTLVVLTSNVLVKIINRFFPKIEKVTTKKSNDTIDSKKLAVINAAIDQISLGKAKIRSIKKIN
ncbi:MAG: hypothetical protein CSA15_07210 [Candidatus Delongbacteria bacterium]|nr:MAG: hypothetical protein CSA15_07210 [Candidatus Delongbacteria bacterium]